MTHVLTVLSACARALLITRPGGMYLIYKHDARGREAPEGGVLINQIHPDWACHK